MGMTILATVRAMTSGKGGGGTMKLIRAVILFALLMMPLGARGETVLVRTLGTTSDTLGYINQGLGDLAPTNSADPLAYYFPLTDDPDRTFPTPPDLSSITALGSWLTTPSLLPLTGTWEGPTIVPTQWPVNQELGIVYLLDGGEWGYDNVVARFGIDNGLFVWLNGEYRFGAMAPGEPTLGEYTVPLGRLQPGPNYLQILLEDHGITNPI
jgi:hypothetical protein